MMFVSQKIRQVSPKATFCNAKSMYLTNLSTNPNNSKKGGYRNAINRPLATY